jgi:hypothetical protein
MQFKDEAGNVIAEYQDGQLVIAQFAIPATLLQQSPQGHEDVKAVDKFLRTWTIDNRKVLVDGALYNWGVADSYLMWDNELYSHNLALPASNQYVAEITDEDGNHVGWAQPVPDPRGNDGNGNGGSEPTMDTLQTRGSISGKTLTVQSSEGFSVGDGIIIPATQGRGKRGPGGTYPSRVYASESEMHAHAGDIPAGGIAGCLDSGRTFGRPPWDPQLYPMLDMGHWYLGHIAPKAYFATIEKIQGNKWTMSKAAMVDVSDVDVFYDASIDVLMAVENGDYNLNNIFPKWKRAAINGLLIWYNMHDAKLTCDKKGSFELFAPLGCPFGVEFRDGRNCVSNFVTLRGTAGDDGYALNWEGSTGVYGYHGMLTDDNAFTPAAFNAGHQFWGCDGCVHEDAEVIDAWVRATGGESDGDCTSQRIKITQTQPLRQYIQWHAQYGSTRSKCKLIDIEFDSVALLPGIEGMHGDVDIIRAHGKNFTMAMNNASGTVERPDIELTPGCVTVHQDYPIFSQSFNYAPIINLNKNASPNNPWGAQRGITLVHPVVRQPENISEVQGSMTFVNVQELPNFKLLEGMDATYPDNITAGNGAVGLQSYALSGYYDGHMDIKGECVNERNAWKVFVQGNPQAGPNLVLPEGESQFG